MAEGAGGRSESLGRRENDLDVEAVVPTPSTPTQADGKDLIVSLQPFSRTKKARSVQMLPINTDTNASEANGKSASPTSSPPPTPSSPEQSDGRQVLLPFPDPVLPPAKKQPPAVRKYVESGQYIDIKKAVLAFVEKIDAIRRSDASNFASTKDLLSYAVFREGWKSLGFGNVQVMIKSEESVAMVLDVLFQTAIDFTCTGTVLEERAGGLYALYTTYFCNLVDPRVRIFVDKGSWSSIIQVAKDLESLGLREGLHMLSRLHSDRAFQYRATRSQMADVTTDLFVEKEVHALLNSEPVRAAINENKPDYAQLSELDEVKELIAKYQLDKSSLAATHAGHSMVGDTLPMSVLQVASTVVADLCSSLDEITEAGRAENLEFFDERETAQERVIKRLKGKAKENAKQAEDGGDAAVKGDVSGRGGKAGQVKGRDTGGTERASTGEDVISKTNLTDMVRELETRRGDNEDIAPEDYRRRFPNFTPNGGRFDKLIYDKIAIERRKELQKMMQGPSDQKDTSVQVHPTLVTSEIVSPPKALESSEVSAGDAPNASRVPDVVTTRPQVQDALSHPPVTPNVVTTARMTSPRKESGKPPQAAKRSDNSVQAERKRKSPDDEKAAAPIGQGTKARRLSESSGGPVTRTQRLTSASSGGVECHNSKCEKCGGDAGSRGKRLVLCIDCPKVLHLSCCSPPLKQVKKNWKCQSCEDHDREIEALMKEAHDSLDWQIDV